MTPCIPLSNKSMNRDRALFIDHEASHLERIAAYLASEPIDLDLQTDSRMAWVQLESSAEHYSLVFIDCQMPQLDGLGFLRRMKAHPRFAEIPVIMQISATCLEKVSEGLQAGACYFLFKPFQPEMLLSMVRGALEDHRSLRVGRNLSKHQEATRNLLLSAEYRFRDLSDVNHLVPVLASFAPQPHLTASGLADLMVNAIEHGNLGITYAEKARLKLDDAWEAEIERRLALPFNYGRFALVKLEQFPDRIEYTIIDQGPGFDWQRYLEFDPDRAFDLNGRGIALARKMSFSGLEFLGCGNRVLATVLR